MGDANALTQWQPAQANYTAWTFDPTYIGTQTAPSAGFVFLCQIFVPNTITINNVGYAVLTAGTGAQLPVNCFVGLYDATGQGRGTSAAQDTAMQSTGYKTAALTVAAGQSLTLDARVAAYAWLAVLIGTQSTTNVQLAVCGFNSSVTAAAINGQLPASQLRFGRLGGGASALPASFVPSTLVTPSVGEYWLAGF
jgi:hypothetical protein